MKLDAAAAGIVARSGSPPEGARDASVQQAARQLEAFFLRQLLAEARPEGGGMLDGGFAGDTFKQMLDEAVADKVSAAGGLGMADMFAKQLSGKGATTAAPGAGAFPPPASAALSFAAPAPAAPHAHGELAAIPHAHELPTGRFALPVAGRATSAYGMRTDPVHHVRQLHPGIDLAAPTGTPVSAAAGGTITHAGPAGTYGNLVIIRHEDGLETRYAHLSEVTVAKGDNVQPNQAVGRVGSTGKSTGPHLHFEVRRDGLPIDPSPFLSLNTSPARTNR